jgi:hypothetical protein
VLDPVGVKIGYYPPPSAEERLHSDMTNPDSFTRRAAMKGGDKSCCLCGAESGEGGAPLRRCSRCKVVRIHMHTHTCIIHAQCIQ